MTACVSPAALICWDAGIDVKSERASSGVYSYASIQGRAISLQHSDLRWILMQGVFS